jgi:hypothetical protein
MLCMLWTCASYGGCARACCSSRGEVPFNDHTQQAACCSQEEGWREGSYYMACNPLPENHTWEPLVRDEDHFNSRGQLDSHDKFAVYSLFIILWRSDGRVILALIEK